MYTFRTTFGILIAAAGLCSLLTAAPLPAAEKLDGGREFKEHCSVCHPNGGNIVKGDKTLSKADRVRHGIRSADDIVRLMRKPGPGMTVFDRTRVSDREARAIAEYIIRTFK